MNGTRAWGLAEELSDRLEDRTQKAGSRSQVPAPRRFFFSFPVPRVNGRSSGRGKGRAGSGCLGNFPAA